MEPRDLFQIIDIDITKVDPDPNAFNLTFEDDLSYFTRLYNQNVDGHFFWLMRMSKNATGHMPDPEMINDINN